MKKIGALFNIILILYAIGWVSKFFSSSDEKKVPEPAFYAQSGGEIASKDWLGYKNLLLVGVDAPVPPKTSEDKGEPFGREARELVEAAIKSGNLYLEDAGSWKGYKHYVYAWIDKPSDISDDTIRRQMINALVIGKGYAKYNPKQTVPNEEITSAYAKVFLTVQKEAQDADAGIWSLAENSKEARAKAEAIKRQKIAKAEKERLERVKELNTVAVTGGKIYHELSCSTLKKSHRTMTVKQALSRGYRPCKVCSPPHEEVKPDDLPLWVDLD